RTVGIRGKPPPGHPLVGAEKQKQKEQPGRVEDETRDEAGDGESGDDQQQAADEIQVSGGHYPPPKRCRGQHHLTTPAPARTTPAKAERRLHSATWSAA